MKSKDPSNEFVKHFAKQIYSGKSITANVLEEFREITQKAFSQYISERISDRLNSALNKEQEKQKQETITTEEVEKSKVITTE